MNEQERKEFKDKMRAMTLDQLIEATEEKKCFFCGLMTVTFDKCSHCGAEVE